jgi:1-acyl-sn-glycerol-3-phosphate acyltransferase
MDWKRIAYATVGTVVAYCLIVPVWVVIIFGKIRIVGFATAKKAVAEGKVLIIANHPSLIETVVLPALFWGEGLIGRSRWVPWSIADELLFPKSWLYNSFRCLPVSRQQDRVSQKKNVQAIRMMQNRLEQQGSIILYPEGGRTCKGTEHISRNSRRVRVCDSKLVVQSVRCGAKVLPVWIDHGTVTEPESFWQGYKKLFFGPVMTVTFGKPVSLQGEVVTSQSVAELLLSAQQ